MQNTQNISAKLRTKRPVVKPRVPTAPQNHKRKQRKRKAKKQTAQPLNHHGDYTKMKLSNITKPSLLDKVKIAFLELYYLMGGK